MLSPADPIVICQTCALCQRSHPLDEEHFDYCPRCGRLVCKERCARTCPFCRVIRCAVCLEEIHGNAYGSACEKCSAAFKAAGQIK